jgi:TatD DNase family protein
VTVGWVDSHCHLYLAAEPASALLDRAVAAGVEWVMCPGVDLETSLAARRLAAENPARVRWSAGLHPHDAGAWDDSSGRLRSLAGAASAVGECGLDFYRNLSDPDAQRRAFTAQLALAAELAKPVIVHCRDAFAEVHAAVERAGLGEAVVLHCWTGGPKWTRRFAELGVTFSFAGPVTFETGDTVRRGAEAAPPERTMVETDTPYLTPPPRRAAANEPANVVRVGEALAGVWGLDVDRVAALTTATATRLFGDPGRATAAAPP